MAAIYWILLTLVWMKSVLKVVLKVIPISTACLKTNLEFRQAGSDCRKILITGPLSKVIGLFRQLVIEALV